MLELTAGLLLPVRRCSPFTEELVVQYVPAPAELLVQATDRVAATQPIARLAAGRGPGRRLRVVDVAGELDLPERDLPSVMLKRRGDVVQAGEVLAVHRGRLPFLNRPCRATVSGEVVAMTHGWVVIEAPGETLDIPALVPGQVVEVNSAPSGAGTGWSVVIRYTGALIEGACGVGGPAVGRLYCCDVTTDGEAPSECIPDAARAAILVVAGCATPELVERAAAAGVAGIVAGSLSLDLVEASPLPVVATEGYGRQQMAADRFVLLRQLAGREAVLIVPQADIWRDRLPAVLVPAEAPEAEDAGVPSDQQFGRPLRPGDRVRAVRAPFVGLPGRVIDVRPPAGWAHLAGGVPACQVRFDSAAEGESGSESQVQWVPWLNLERIG
jgi:hypothetical protein